MRAILLAKSNEIMRQVLFPHSRGGRRAGVNRADAGIGVGLKRRVGMRSRPRIVRTVVDARDAGVEQRQHRQKIANIDVVRLVLERKISVQGVDVFRKIDIGNDAPELVLPAVTVAVDKSRHDDHAAHLEDDRIRTDFGRKIRSDRLYGLAADEQIAIVEIADRRIDRDQGRALEQNARIATGGFQSTKSCGPFFIGLLIVRPRPWRRHRSSLISNCDVRSSFRTPY